jgi:hypothetical protein
MVFDGPVGTFQAAAKYARFICLMQQFSHKLIACVGTPDTSILTLRDRDQPYIFQKY